MFKTSQIKAFLSALFIFMSGGLFAQADQFATRGREFWLGFMQNASGTQQLSLRIASGTATSGTVSIPLAGWSNTYVVAANGVTTVVVPNTYEIIGSEAALDRGVHVTSVDPVTVSAINYQNQTTDAFQVLPVESLGTTYRVEALPGTNISYPNGTFMFRSEFVVVATEDGTALQITPSATTTAGRLPNVPFTINLNAGQTYQVQAFSGITDLTGTLIQASDSSGPCRPFAVFGGSMCAVVGCAACDHVNEQMVPVKA
ncbi:MAG: IgGFc-binding protein, partial [Flavobacteriales bacterium]